MNQIPLQLSQPINGMPNILDGVFLLHSRTASPTSATQNLTNDPSLQNRIMVSLTSQLVLASFFSQGSLTIPKTSYLKLIDVWYVSLISQVFVVIVSLVLIEVLRLRGLRGSDGIKTVHVTPVNSMKVPHSFPELSPINKADRLNAIFIFLFPTIFFSFITYFAVACVRGLKS